MEWESSCVPPGFRFHPTEEELVGYYLRRKVESLQIDLDVIADLDLYRMEPWEIEGKCKLGYEEQNEWFFFSHKDRKYPTGTRTNRATSGGFWKATGRDKAVVSKDRVVIGMRKTLVFYNGRAPNGRKSEWIMHEYRLQSSQHAAPQEEGWVVCRAFKKPNPIQKQRFEAWNNNVLQTRTLPPVLNQLTNPPQLLFDAPEQSYTINTHSPTSRSFAHNEDDTGFDFNSYNQSDWTNIHKIIDSDIDKPPSFQHSSTPLMMHNTVGSPDQITHLFGCLYDL